MNDTTNSSTSSNSEGASLRYVAKDTKSTSAALLAAQLAAGKAGEHMLRSGVNQQAVCLYAAKLAMAYVAKAKRDASAAQLADLFAAAGITNSSALSKAAEAIVSIDADGKERSAMPTTGRAALPSSAWADL